MNKFIKIYLKLIPFISLLGIILSTLRIVYSSQATFFLLVIGAILDLIIILYGYRYLLNKLIGLVFILLICSVVVGLLNGNELSRHYITDFTNPFFFFSKILIFAQYWKVNSFKEYVKFYSKISLWGSLILLPIVYLIFHSGGVRRIAIFPPLELPFSVYMQSGGVFFILTFIIILLYGKRSQLLSAIITFVWFIYKYKRKNIFKYLLVLLVIIMGVNFIFSNYSDNLAVGRINSTLENFTNSKNTYEGVENISSGRDAEVEAIIADMGFWDYILGKGCGVSVELLLGREKKEVSNIHFTPLSLIFKYGIIFTLFFYYFMVREILKFNKKGVSKYYIVAYGTLFFVFLESFFSYAIFVTSILPISLGYLYYFRLNKWKD
ncbi:hypothetical protein [Mesonia aquimarina]|uniref:hypothetical protein n=1 Tax=Mesonia aquimarina TaxID=1504967 RepID=UPI000EF5AD54|nr:hypothetical protein [Mesonia aquimarina]